MNNNFDAIVIGAGSTGIPITYFLTQKGLRVLCIDENSSAGQGQNKAAIGGVRATHSDLAKIKICQQSIDFFSTWKEKHGIEIGWKKGGYSFPVYREREEKILKSILPVQKKQNLNIDWVDAEFIREIIPGINPEGLMGGTFSPDDGQVSPLLAIEAIEKVAKESGATFLYDTQVNDLIVKKEKIIGVRASHEIYNTNIVVNAAGAYADKIGEMARVKIPLIPDSHEAGISAPVEEFLKPLVVDLRPGEDGKTSIFYFGQNHDKGIIFCFTPGTLIPGYDRTSTSDFMPIMVKRLLGLIPRLKNLRVRRIWRGLYPMTPDGTAIVGKAPNIEGFYLSAGMCGQGFMMGPGVAQNLASLITTGKPIIDEDIFKTLRPDRDFYSGKTEFLK
jgi:sarcosine oxidase, subunit beta